MINANNDNIIIKGTGPTKTKLLFDCDVDYFDGLIWAESKAGYSDRNKPISLSVTSKTGDKTITLSYTNSDVKVGSLVCIKENNPPDLMFPEANTSEAWYKKWEAGKAEWAVKSYGQSNKIIAVNGNTVNFRKSNIY